MTEQHEISSEDREILLRAQRLAPQPIAVAAGRVLRSRTANQRLQNAYKGGETLARYVAAISAASYSCRSEEAPNPPVPLSGDLSFGDFLSLVQQVAKLSDHALASELAPYRKSKRGPGKADTALLRLVKLRNDEGHDLAEVTEARALVLLRETEPVESLCQALKSSEVLTKFPLLVAENVWFAEGRILARILWLMGESQDPEPVEVELQAPLHSTATPYVAVRENLLALPPLAAWRIITERKRWGLVLLDGIGDDSVRYQSLEGIEEDHNGPTVQALQEVLEGPPTAPERIVCKSGDRLDSLWTEKRIRLADALRVERGAIPWKQLDEGTLRWFASRISAIESATEARGVVAEHLLDGRDTLDRREAEQLCLLLGDERYVRRTVRRPLLDLRALEDADERWSERIESHANVIESLRSAVAFFGHHLKLGDVSVDGLKETTGTADYVAMREALVNLFIHQDYTDPSAAAQVELQPERASFFNPGHSLVGTEQLVEGGKSQARNPLIARALRLLGFAELAGSGVRAVQSAWRRANRRPPRFESDEAANSFSLTLDWRKVADTFDPAWKDRLGVNLSTEQAQILNLAIEAEGLRVEEAASGAGLRVDDAREALSYLQLQGLLRTAGDRWYLQEHLRELMDDPVWTGTEEGSDGG